MILFSLQIQRKINYCLLGATGYIGEELIDILHKQEDSGQIYIMYRNKSHFSQYLNTVLSQCDENVQLFQGDIMNISQQIKDYIKKSDIIVYMCGNSKWGHIENQQTTKVTNQIEQICDILSPNQRLIFISSMAAQLSEKLVIRHNLIYARAKQLAENIIQKKCNNYIIIRPGEVYSPYDVNKITARNVLDYMQNIGFVINGGVSVTSRTSICQGILKASQLLNGDSRVNQIYSFGGENLTINEFCRLIQKISGKGHFVVKIPNFVAKSGSKITKLFEYEAVKYGCFEWYVTPQEKQKADILGYKSPIAKDVLSEVITNFNTNLRGFK